MFVFTKISHFFFWQNSCFNISLTQHSIVYGPWYLACRRLPTIGSRTNTWSPTLKTRSLAFQLYQTFICVCTRLKFFLANSLASSKQVLEVITYSKRLQGSYSTASQLSFSIFNGPRTMWPKTNSNGLKPKISCTDSLVANISRWIPSIPVLLVIKTIASHHRLHGLQYSEVE